MPTRSFWRDRDNRRLVAPFVGAALGLTIFLLVLLPPLGLVGGGLAGTALGAFVPFLTMGIVERVIRRRITERRALASAERLDALPPA